MGESIRLALLAEGIEAVVLDPQSPGYIGFAGRVRVAVNDTDLPRAREVLQQFESEKTQPTPAWRWQRRVFLLIGTAFVLLTVAGMWQAPQPILILLVLGVVGLLAGVVALLLRGYRTDRERTRPRL